MEDSETGRPGRRAKLASAGGLTPQERAGFVADSKGTIPEVPNGANTGQCVPVSPQAIAEARKPIGYVAHQEPMTIYELEDGSMIRTKVVLMDVEVVEGVYLPDGTPVYNCVWNQVTYVSAPEHLKRKAGS